MSWYKLSKICVKKNKNSDHKVQLTDTVVTEAAVGGTWRSEDFAGEAIFQLNCLTIDDDLLGPGRRPVARAAVGHICGKKQLEHKAKLFQELFY